MLRELSRSIAGRFGVELTRLRTHRGISLCADLRRFLKDSDGAVFDVGANVGAFTQMIAKAFPERIVFACEPVPSTVQQLRRNVGHLEGVRIVEGACGERCGETRMEIGQQSGWNKVVSDSSAEGVVSVPMLSIDAICARETIHRIILIKTDCEGYDLNVLRGAEGMLSDQSVEAVYCEVNFRRDGRHGDFFTIDEYLSRFGFVFYALYDYSGPQYPMSETFANALWIPKESIA